MNTFYSKLLGTASLLLLGMLAYAQQPELGYFRAPDKTGINQFEAPKDEGIPFEGVKVRLGGDFALQFQGLSQSNDLVGDTLVDLANNFNLPSANLNLDIQLYSGVRLHMRTYLSSRHHNEAWVKGGYLQIDELDFISEDFLSGLMKVTRFRFGMDEINYGDTHFRRSDNAQAIYNPFVGNYIMDAFTTEPFGEVSVFSSGLLAVVGVTNGRLNQSPTPGDGGAAFYGKLGYDSELSEDLRIRLTGSLYSSTSKSTRDYIYNGDRAGARYYNIMEGINDANPSDFLPRHNTGFAYQTAFQINPFIKFQGLEVFGVFEVANNGDDEVGGGFTQLGAEGLYRFGNEENLYVGGRYNTISGETSDATETLKISRLNVGGGWFLTKNILAKLEYVQQTYDGDGYDGTKFQGAEFSGVVLEAAISF